MKHKLITALAIGWALCAIAGSAGAQPSGPTNAPPNAPPNAPMGPPPMMKGPPGADHEPPPHAYEDCKGKTEGAAIMHQTPEGMVAAHCMMSPKGLVARPDRPPNPNGPPKGSNPPPSQPGQMPPPK